MTRVIWTIVAAAGLCLLFGRPLMAASVIDVFSEHCDPLVKNYMADLRPNDRADVLAIWEDPKSRHIDWSTPDLDTEARHICVLMKVTLPDQTSFEARYLCSEINPGSMLSNWVFGNRAVADVVCDEPPEAGR